jgi:hypothetical protein
MAGQQILDLPVGVRVPVRERGCGTHPRTPGSSVPLLIRDKRKARPAPIAQSAERRSRKAQVTGSIPVGGSQEEQRMNGTLLIPGGGHHAEGPWRNGRRACLRCMCPQGMGVQFPPGPLGIATNRGAGSKAPRVLAGSSLQFPGPRAALAVARATRPCSSAGRAAHL